MKISDSEKLILFMLSELYEAVGVNGEIDPAFIRSAIFYENTWSIPWKYPGIGFAEEETPPIVKNVLDILQMWSCIESSYDKLTDEEKKQVEDKAAPFGKDPKFKGFDGNNESEYMIVASTLINQLDRFSEFKDRYLNSHCPNLAAYNRMLSLYHEFKQNNGYGELTLKQLIDLLNAKRHPSES